MKELMNEWKKYIAEGKNTPPTPLPAGSKWDGKSAFAYNDKMGMHFFTPGIGWQTISNPEPVKTVAPVAKEQVKLYPIDMATAKRYDAAAAVFDKVKDQENQIMKRCMDVFFGDSEDGRKEECDKSMIDLKKQRKELFQMLIKPEERDALNHYIQNRDLYISKLTSSKVKS